MNLKEKCAERHYNADKCGIFPRLILLLLLFFYLSVCCVIFFNTFYFRGNFICVIFVCLEKHRFAYPKSFYCSFVYIHYVPLRALFILEITHLTIQAAFIMCAHTHIRIPSMQNIQFYISNNNRAAIYSFQVPLICMWLFMLEWHTNKITRVVFYHLVKKNEKKNYKYFTRKATKIDRKKLVSAITTENIRKNIERKKIWKITK